ncbi:hypothetical protein CHARACLAT_016923 [Characodon lateralis]|uniref:Uncharacterized protein n=1 Tax=Characodon lateralis TaxID=208331 RepID=A0ABU7EU98_9TELE|nr:hypothetical protein [Characodon lateralis]
MELVQCSTAGTKTTLLLLKPRFDYRLDSPLQHFCIGLTREAVVGTHPPVPLLIKGVRPLGPLVCRILDHLHVAGRHYAFPTSSAILYRRIVCSYKISYLQVLFLFRSFKP